MSKYKPLLVTLPEEHIKLLEWMASQRPPVKGRRVNAGYVASGILMRELSKIQGRA
jgi:hypothetical protein